MSTETKPTNPKDAIGSGKLPLDLVPDTAIVELATGFLEGALKYGKYNWRVEGVRASIYIAAAGRHMAKYKNGEDRDQKTRVKHLASVMACCAIIMDAELCGKLVDDRPPVAPMRELIDGYAEQVAYLKELFKDHHPHQHTIQDAQITEDPSVANFVRANGEQALFSQEAHKCKDGCPGCNPPEPGNLFPITKAAGETS